jgi:hypothetical protein
MSSERSWANGPPRLAISHVSYSLIVQIPGADLSRGLRPPAGNSGSGQAVYRHMRMINRAKRFQNAFANSLEYAPHVLATSARRALSDLLLYPFFLS